MEYKDTIEYAKEFQKKFFEVVRPQLQELEKERKKAYAEYQKYHVFLAFFENLLFLFIPCLAIISFIFHAPFGFYILLLPPCLLFFIFISHITSTIQKNFEENMKNKIMPTLMTAFGDFEWSTDSIISDYDVTDTGLYIIEGYMHSGACVNDNFWGTYNDVKIKISEAEFEYKTKELYVKDNKGSTKNLFNGILVNITLPKSFSGRTYIYKKNRKKFHPAIDKDCEKINLEFSDFSNNYDIYSTDQIEARYLLTTAFMERFFNLGKIFKSDDIDAVFRGNTLLMGIYTGWDRFNLCDIKKPIDDIEQYKELFNEIVSILEIVDTLKLNKNIGL